MIGFRGETLPVNFLSLSSRKFPIQRMSGPTASHSSPSDEHKVRSASCWKIVPQTVLLSKSEMRFQGKTHLGDKKLLNLFFRSSERQIEILFESREFIHSAGGRHSLKILRYWARESGANWFLILKNFLPVASRAAIFIFAVAIQQIFTISFSISVWGWFINDVIALNDHFPSQLRWNNFEQK